MADILEFPISAADAGAGAPVEVAAGVLRDGQGRVLVSQRLAGRHLAGLWEFPGGKVEAGESASDALARELDEELGIKLGPARPLVTVTHQYAEKTIRLKLLEVHSFEGTPEGREGQALKWVDEAELKQLEMPEADRPLVRVLGLDSHYSISPSPASFGSNHEFLARWRGCLEAGFRLIRLRPAHGERVDASLIDELASTTREFGARWLASGDLDECLDWPADGVHLTVRQLVGLHRRPVGAERLLAASCHDLEEVRMAADIEADFVTLSPVAATPGHPDAPPLGWSDFERVVRHSPVPVLALGGVEPDDWGRARAAGAFGVAGIRAFGWR